MTGDQSDGDLLPTRRTISPKTTLLLLVVAGLGLRLALAATTDGNRFDLASLRVVADLLTSGDPFGLYSQVTVSTSAFELSRWPYPPGYHPAVLLTAALDGPLGVPFERLIRGPAILADFAIAAVLYSALTRTHGPRVAVGAAAAVLLGPSFVANSAAHGQLDSAAVLAPLVAVVLWQRGDERRWLWCGLLIGAGAAIKTPMGLFLLALLPTASSRSELVRTASVAVGVPLLLLTPFLVSTPRATVEQLTYGGLPGIGGLSLLVQPDLAVGWLGGRELRLTGLSTAVRDIAPLVTLAGIAATAWLLWTRRVAAAPAAVMIVLVLWAVGVNFTLGYALWGLPFLLLCGRVRLAWLLQAVLLVPIFLVYAMPDGGWDPAVIWVGFVPPMLCFLGLSVYLLVNEIRWQAKSASAPAPGAALG